MAQNQIVGKYGEDLAEQYLRDRGYLIVDRNWRCASGEIDLVASHHGRYIFVEVKTRNGSGFGHPFEAITAQKVARMRRLVSQWCLANQKSGVDVRLDAIAVVISGGRVAVEHLKQVF